MIATLNTLNENINSLGESPKNIGIGGEKEDKASMDFRPTEGEMKETKGPTYQPSDPKYEQVGIDTGSVNEVAETLQVLDRENK